MQADESLGAFQAGDVLCLRRQLFETNVDDALAVDPDAALAAVAANAHGLPFAGLLGGTLAGRLDGINGTGKLCRLEAFPFGAVIIKHLNLQPGHPRCTGLGRANEHAAVAVLGDVVLELQFKIGKLLLGGEPGGTGLAGARQDAVLDFPVGHRPAHALPAGEVFAVEERLKVLVRRRNRQCTRRNHSEDELHAPTVNRRSWAAMHLSCSVLPR